MAICKIKNECGLVLNRFGDSMKKAAAYDRITLFEDTGTNDQKFEMVYIGDYVYFKLQSNPLLVLNRRSDTGEIMVYPFSKSKQTDILFNTETVDGKMRIIMPHYNQYLTSSSIVSGASVNASEKQATITQYWTLDFVMDKDNTMPIATNDTKIIKMPTNPNQKYSGYNSTINKYGCAMCCGLAVSCYYNESQNNTMDYFYKNYWIQGVGYSWNSPSAVMSDGQFSIDTVKKEIDAARPVIIHGTYGTKTHWVVAYGYVDGCKSANDILVMDPYNSSASSPTGSLRTLTQAMNISIGSNHKFGRIKTTKNK